MNGQKAKALRKLARYSVTSDRPELPQGEWLLRFGPCTLPRTHARKKYKFLKRRYGNIPMPLAAGLKRMHKSTALVEAIDQRMNPAA